MQIVNKTARTVTVEVAGLVLKVKKNSSNRRTRAGLPVMESRRWSRVTTWSCDQLNLSSVSRLKVEAVLWALESGLAVEDAVNVVLRTGR